MATQVYLGVGSNLNRDNALRFARKNLEALLHDCTCSSVWVSHAVREAEPDYYNMVVSGSTELSLEDLLKALTELEQTAGKEMMFHNGTNFGIKRRLDIDVLLYGNLITSEPCKLPRHDIQDYPFVLCPLCELNANLVHPLLNIPIREIWNEMEPRLPEKMKVSKTSIDWSLPVPNWNGDAE